MANNREHGLRVKDAVAGLVRSVLLARCRDQPDYRNEAASRGWKSPELDAEWRSLASLLRRVDWHRSLFYSEFYGNQDSIPYPSGDVDDATKAIDEVIEFLHGDLVAAAVRAARREPIDWDEVADWSRLERLREILNRLTISKGEAPALGPSGDGCFHYDGRRHEMPRGQPRRLIVELWKSRTRQRTFSELAAPVFGDGCLSVEDIAERFRGPQAAANSFFKTFGLPYKIEKERGEFVAVLKEVHPLDSTRQIKR